MPERFNGKLTEEQYKEIDKICEEKNVKTEQFLDFFIGYKHGLISGLIEKFIDYNHADGWLHYQRDDNFVETKTKKVEYKVSDNCEICNNRFQCQTAKDFKEGKATEKEIAECRNFDDVYAH